MLSELVDTILASDLPQLALIFLGWIHLSSQSLILLQRNIAHPGSSFTSESLVEDIQIPQSTGGPPIRWRVGIGPDPAYGGSGSGELCPDPGEGQEE